MAYHGILDELYSLMPTPTFDPTRSVNDSNYISAMESWVATIKQWHKGPNDDVGFLLKWAAPAILNEQLLIEHPQLVTLWNEYQVMARLLEPRLSGIINEIIADREILILQSIVGHLSEYEV